VSFGYLPDSCGGVEVAELQLGRLLIVHSYSDLGQYLPLNDAEIVVRVAGDKQAEASGDAP